MMKSKSTESVKDVFYTLKNREKVFLDSLNSKHPISFPLGFPGRNYKACLFAMVSLSMRVAVNGGKLKLLAPGKLSGEFVFEKSDDESNIIHTKLEINPEHYKVTILAGSSFKNIEVYFPTFTTSGELNESGHIVICK